MNKQKYFFTLLGIFSSVLLLSSAAFGQNQLEGILHQISDKIQRVEAGGGATDQSLRFDSDRPWRLTLLSTIISKKGAAEEVESHFNLSDIDKNTVRYSTKKDLIFVQLRTERQQRFIKTYENAELQNYENELIIKAIDVDNAKALVNLFKQALDIEITVDGPSISSYEEGLSWMEANVKAVNIGESTLDQLWERAANNTLKCKLTTTSEGKKSSTTEERTFNLGDFGEHTLGVEVKGKQVFLKAKIRRSEKFVEKWEDGEKEKYESEIKIYLDDIDQARSMLLVMAFLVKEADEKLSNSLPAELSLDEILDQLSQTVTTVDIGDKSFIQSMSPSCLTTINIKETGGKESEEAQLMFHLGDLRANSVDISVSGEKITIALKTASGDKLIQTEENGEAENYTDKTSILSSDVENMRQLRHLLPMAIEGCSQQLEEQMAQISQKTEGITERVFAKIIDKTGEDDALLQTLAAIDGDCKWSLITVETDSKSSKELLWEFNNSDLDAKSLKFRISKTDVFVEVTTRYKEKIIKAYKDGEPDDYASSLQVWVENVEQGRILIALWQQAIKACGE